jgi:hypothetical protein
MRRREDAVLNPQVLDQEFDRSVVVCLNAPHFGSGQDYDRRFFFGKECCNSELIAKVKLRSIPFEQVIKTLRLKPADERAAHHAAMTGYENFVDLVHY